MIEIYEPNPDSWLIELILNDGLIIGDGFGLRLVDMSPEGDGIINAVYDVEPLADKVNQI